MLFMGLLLAFSGVAVITLLITKGATNYDAPLLKPRASTSFPSLFPKNHYQTATLMTIAPPFIPTRP